MGIMRRGWCPTPLRPMMTGDGLLVRLRIAGATITLRQADTIAAAALQFGNGLIDITQRANLQLRGVREDAHDAMLASLAAHDLVPGWGLLHHGTEAVSNIVSSPLAGLQNSALIDIRPIVAALAARLDADAALRALPGKFGFVIDDGGAHGVADVEADVRFVAVLHDGRSKFAVHIAGVGAAVRLCEPNEVADVAAHLAHAFIAMTGGGAPARRMREVSNRMFPDLAKANRRPEAPSPAADLIGAHKVGASYFLGFGAPFGRINANDLIQLASAVEAWGGKDIRVTPWRVLLATGLSAQACARILHAASHTDFITKGDDPRLAIAACPGSPACANASTPVHADAARIAHALGAHLMSPQAGTHLPGIHVSGCTKGCARLAPQSFTLVARDGRYDVIVDGTAASQPAQRGLDIDAATHLIMQAIATTHGECRFDANA